MTVDLANEKEIVWVKGSSGDYSYLREIMSLSPTRTRKVGNRNVVAYATLKEGTKRGPGYGYFLRRAWIHRDTDPYPCESDHPNYYNVCPTEAVKPSSIRAGFSSEGGRE